MVGFDEFDQRKPWTFGHGWLKLTSFAQQLYDLQGRTLVGIEHALGMQRIEDRR